MAGSRKRGDDCGLRHKLSALDWLEITHGRAVASHDEGFAAIQLPHDLAAVVAQLTLGYHTCHMGSVAPVLPVAVAADGLQDAVSSLGELPGVGLALGVSLAVVLDQLVTLEACE